MISRVGPEGWATIQTDRLGSGNRPQWASKGRLLSMDQHVHFLAVNSALREPSGPGSLV